MKRIALIPAYEPDEHLPRMLDILNAADIERVVVDDGSGAGYEKIFSTVPEGTVVLVHEKNLGKGQAIKTGLEYIKNSFHTDAVIVTMDSDGQHTVSDALRCLDAAERKPGSLILGCRTFSSSVPLRSRFGNSVTRAVYRIASGVCVSDTQTGLRAFTSGMIPLLLSVEGSRYEYEMNVLLECPRSGVAISEVPVATIYENNNSGSHFNTLRDSFIIYRDILKFALSSFIGFLTDYSLYSLLAVITAPLGAISVPMSNITARIVSAGVNYTINRRYIFNSHESVLRTGTQYFILAACILCGNTFLLSWLVNTLGVNRFAAKLVTELTFFTLSWIAQKTVIFRKKSAGR